MVGTGGLLAPVMGAFLAVAQRRSAPRARVPHGEDDGRLRPPAEWRDHAPAHASGPTRAHRDPTGPAATAEGMVNVMGDMAPLLTYGAYSAANWLAMHAQRHMYLYGTTKEQLGCARGEQPAERGLQPARGVPRADDDGRLPRRAAGLRSVRAARLRRVRSTARSRSSCRRPTHAADCPNPPVRVESMGGARGHGAAGTSGPTTRRWRRSTRPTNCGARPTSRPADVDIAELYDGFTFLTFAWLEALGFCGDR